MKIQLNESVFTMKSKLTTLQKTRKHQENQEGRKNKENQIIKEPRKVQT